MVSFDLHLISDGTGETISVLAKAVCAQFEAATPNEHSYGLVRNEKQMQKIIDNIEEHPGPVFFSIVDDRLREKLERVCARLSVPCLSVLDPFISEMVDYLKIPVSGKAGGQHIMDRDYFQRISALNYTMMHDDGQSQGDLNEADIIITGISRTSKTPTCIYLANRGLKAANVPLVMGIELPKELFSLTKPLIIGLTTNADRLIQIRRNRLLLLNEENETEYIDPDMIKQELLEARRFMMQKNWPIIDVSRRSVEEVAAEILNIYQRRQENSDHGQT